MTRGHGEIGPRAALRADRRAAVGDGIERAAQQHAQAMIRARDQGERGQRADPAAEKRGENVVQRRRTVERVEQQIDQRIVGVDSDQQPDRPGRHRSGVPFFGHSGRGVALMCPSGTTSTAGTRPAAVRSA